MIRNLTTSVCSAASVVYQQLIQWGIVYLWITSLYYYMHLWFSCFVWSPIVFTLWSYIYFCGTNKRASGGGLATQGVVSLAVIPVQLPEWQPGWNRPEWVEGKSEASCSPSDGCAFLLVFIVLMVILLFLSHSQVEAELCICLVLLVAAGISSWHPKLRLTGLILPKFL